MLEWIKQTNKQAKTGKYRKWN